MFTKFEELSRDKTNRLVGATTSIRVVLADSRPVVLHGLEELIDAHKPAIQVIGQASSYARAIYLTEQLRPDVVLLSFFQDTLDFLQALSTLLRYNGTKVLLLKGMNETAPVSKALGMGAAGVVMAEDSAESIVRALMHVCGREARPGKAWIGGLSRLTVRTQKVKRETDANTKIASLTSRERELIQAILSNPAAKYIAIGAQLGISEHTVHNHLSSIYHKLNLVNRTDLLVYAARHRIGSDDGAPSGWVELN